MNERFDSGADNFSFGHHPSVRYDKVASAMSGWKEKLKENLFLLLLGSAVISSAWLFHRPAAGDEEARTMGGDSFTASQGLAEPTRQEDRRLGGAGLGVSPARLLNKSPGKELSMVAD